MDARGATATQSEFSVPTMQGVNNRYGRSTLVGAVGDPRREADEEGRGVQDGRLLPDEGDAAGRLDEARDDEAERGRVAEAVPRVVGRVEFELEQGGREGRDHEQADDDLVGRRAVVVRDVGH